MTQPTANELALARAVYELQLQVRALSGSRQLPSSTVETDDGALGVLDAAVAGAGAAAAVPELQDGVEYGAASVDGLRDELDNSDDALDDALEDAAADLDDARADIEEGQRLIDDNFVEMGDNVQTAIVSATNAQSAAEAANAQALTAAGLAGSKGKVIVQVTVPSGSNADPANLWINITADANGNPKNQPNRYNPATTSWEPITDRAAVDAASAAAGAASAAAAAQATATQAKTDAATAQSTADNANTQALTAAGIANGKGKVIYQATAPTGSNATTTNLWIRSSDNKPFTYDGTTWNAVTDKAATDAAAAAAAANTAAQNAAAAASAAQATADGRPLILFSTSGPSGNAPTGSTWFQIDTSQSVIGQWQQTGPPTAPVWTARPFTSDVIANLDVGKLTAGTAAIATLVAQKIAASTATFQTVNVSNLFVTTGATMQQAVIDYLFANVVQAKKITASMIDVNTLNGVTLTGTILQTSSSGKRTVISNNRVNFFDENGQASGYVEGTNNGGSRGLLHLASGDGGSHLYMGAGLDLPTAGSAALRMDGLAWLGGLYLDGGITAGGTTSARAYRAPVTNDASLASTGHAFQIGTDDAANLIMDNNEIMARLAGGVSSLFINADGGNVGLGNADSTINIAGLLNNLNLPTRMAAGQFSQAALGNGASATTGITFPSGRFSTGPVVFAIALNSRYNVAMAGNTTKTGGSITVSNWSGASATAAASIWWVAVQMTESSPFG